MVEASGDEARAVAHVSMEEIAAHMGSDVGIMYAIRCVTIAQAAGWFKRLEPESVDDDPAIPYTYVLDVPKLLRAPKEFPIPLDA